MKTKTFDCVEMKRIGAAHVQKELAGLTPQQQLEYWRQQTDQLRRCALTTPTVPAALSGFSRARRPRR